MRHLLLVFICLCSIQTWAQLSDKEIETLTERVRDRYDMMGFGDGAQVYQTSNNRVLVCFATVDSDLKPSQRNRQATMRATRAAVEFLKGAKNKSISINDAYSEKSEIMTEAKGNSVNEGLTTIDSKTSTNMAEQSSSVEKETLSEKIVQKSMAKIDSMQPLMKFNGEDGETIYAFYLLLSKKTAKKKH